MPRLINEFLRDIKLINAIPYTPHPAQLEFHESEARFRIIAAGRRFGKSEAAVNEGIKFAISHSGSIIWIVAPVYAQAMMDWRMVKHFLPREFIKEVHATEKYLELSNNATIWIKSGDNPDTLRGEGIDFLIIDEAAMVKEDVWIEALRPSLSDTQGRAVFISTPRGHNWFYSLWARGQDSAYPDYESWVYPTSANPHIFPQEIEEARHTLPELVFRQEYLAEFMDDVGAVFRGVDTCIRETPPVAMGQTKTDYYVMGADLAKHVDFTVLCVLNSSGHLVAFDRFNQLDWTFQKQRIISTAQKYSAEVILDSTGVGDPIFEDLKRSGNLKVEGYRFTNESKKQLIEALSIAIEQQKISYSNIPELVNELKIFGFNITPTGTITYGAPAGHHDDCVIALALAWHGMKSVGNFDRYMHFLVNKTRRRW